MNRASIKLALLGVVALGLCVWFGWPERVVRHAPGPVAKAIPEQEMLDPPPTWTHGDFMITGLARYRIVAKVLSRERYYLGRESELSPLDFALAWGQVSDQTAIDQLDVSQGHRWYEWSSDAPPLSMAEISANSANVHLIPANDAIEDALFDVETGELVDMGGFLVLVEGDDGWKWQSSISRTDTGDGACEIFWVDELTRRVKAPLEN